jgi:phospholipase C
VKWFKKCFVYFGDSYCVCSKPARDQHPDHDVAEGEMLIKEVYEAVRNGPNWNSTLLLITYDEHGGFYVSATTRTCTLSTLHVFSVILRTDGAQRGPVGMFMGHARGPWASGAMSA